MGPFLILKKRQKNQSITNIPINFIRWSIKYHHGQKKIDDRGSETKYDKTFKHRLISHNDQLAAIAPNLNIKQKKKTKKKERSKEKHDKDKKSAWKRARSVVVVARDPVEMHTCSLKRHMWPTVGYGDRNVVTRNVMPGTSVL